MKSSKNEEHVESEEWGWHKNKDNLKNEHIHENEDDLESKELLKWINMTS